MIDFVILFNRYNHLFEALARYVDYCEKTNRSYGFVKQCIDTWEISLEKYIKECDKNEKI